jgi:hypothetical protein
MSEVQKVQMVGGFFGMDSREELQECDHGSLRLTIAGRLGLLDPKEKRT